MTYATGGLIPERPDLEPPQVERGYLIHPSDISPEARRRLLAAINRRDEVDDA